MGDGLTDPEVEQVSIDEEELRALKDQVDNLLRKNKSLLTQVDCLKSVVSPRPFSGGQRRHSEPPPERRYVGLNNKSDFANVSIVEDLCDVLTHRPKTSRD